MNKEITQYSFFNKIKSLAFIEAVWLFGSRARGENAERADIDLAIICPGATSSDWFKVKEIMEEADTLLKIDCIRFDKLADKNPLKAEILRDKKVLYEKKNP